MTTKLVPPELNGLENQMQDFLAQLRREKMHIVSDPVADYLNAHPPKEKPWKLRFLIVLGLAIYFWWMVGEYVMRMAR
jgi:hypothetical protein